MLDDLFRNRSIRLNRGALFDSDITPKPSSFDYDRVEGMFLGIVIGDALGFLSKSMLPVHRMSAYGGIPGTPLIIEQNQSQTEIQ